MSQEQANNQLFDTMDESELDDFLSVALYRVDCPDSSDLLDYKWKLLTSSAQEQMAQHLAYCPQCRKDLAVFDARPVEKAQRQSQAGWQDNLRRLFAVLTQAPALGVRTSDGEAEPLQTRGVGELVLYEYHVAELDIDVTIKYQLVRGGLYQVDGDVFGEGIENAKLSLESEQQTHRVSIDAFGNFEFSPLVGGAYQPLLIFGEVVVEFPVVQIK